MIKSGDTVIVNFNNSQFTLCKEAKVLHVPTATGDSWQFEDMQTGEIHFVSEGCTVTLTTVTTNLISRLALALRTAEEALIRNRGNGQQPFPDHIQKLLAEANVFDTEMKYHVAASSIGNKTNPI